MALKRAYIFDFDETLVKTRARIHIYRDGVHVGEMNSKQYNFYKRHKDDTFDFSDFNDPELILSAKKYKMWPVIANINKAVKEDRSTSDIYILTARSPIVKSAIYEFLKQNGIEIDIENIITVGDDKGNVDISREKHKWLNKMVKNYDEVQFFDDDPKNIELARGIKGIRTRLVEGATHKSLESKTSSLSVPGMNSDIPCHKASNWIKSNETWHNVIEDEYDNAPFTKTKIKLVKEDMGGASAPMSALSNTPGMGNVTPAGSGTLGSGDNFGALNKKPYTQGKPLKRKRKKKLVKEDFREKSDPIKDMGIGIQGLWDYTPEEAAEEIWAEMKPNIQSHISYALRSGTTFRIKPYSITIEGCAKLGFDPNVETIKYLTKLIEKEIDKSIADNTINFNQNTKYYETNENNISPYDKMGNAMAKKMKVKTPFKKKKEKANQNAVKQENFEHEIITLDEFTQKLNEKNN